LIGAVDYIQRAQRVLDLEIESLQDLRSRLNGSFTRAVGLLLECVEKRGKIIITGVGKSGHIGHKIAATLTSTGAPAVVLDAVNAVHGDMGMITPGDVVVILSYSGETEEIVRILPSIKRFQVKLIAMTGHPESEVAKTADVHLDVSVKQEACPLNLAPTSSTTTMLALGDALAMVLLEARGFQKDDFAKYHPGGSIGRNLFLKVDRVMRPLDQIAVCRESDTVLTALTRISKKRCGAAVVVRDDGTLAGIYTHGDFARGFQKNPDIGSFAVGEVMTAKPICVQVDKLAVEVLNIFENNPIQDLIVLDAGNRPVGLVDVQDLTKFNLL
jgi:arabinose-5-phosphate isomerase